MRPAARARYLCCATLVALAGTGCGTTSARTRAPVRMSAPAAPPIPPPRPAPAHPVPVPHPAPVAAAPAPSVASPPAPAAAPPAAPEPRTIREVLDRLRRDAATGADPDLEAHVALLEAVAGSLPAAGTETVLMRLPDLEAAGVARHGGRLGFATLTSYVEPGGDVEALRRVYLDFDRVPEFTGKPGTRTLSREPDAVVGRTDAMRRTLGIEYGARWTFRSRPIDRGSARLIVSSLVEAADSAHMLFTQGVWIGLPEGDGVRVVEAALSVMDFAVPSMLKGIAEQTARKELLARTEGLRRHWRQYVK